MSETVNEESTTEEISEEELSNLWNSLSEDNKKALTDTADLISKHNQNVKEVRAASEQDPNKLLFEIREENPQNDPKLTKLNERITALNEQYEKLLREANELAKQQLPKDKTPEELEKQRKAISDSGTTIRERIKAFEGYENMLGIKLLIHLPEIENLKGVRKTPGTSGPRQGSSWKPRFSRITLNEEVVGKEVKNPKTGEIQFKSTLTHLGEKLREKTHNPEFTTPRIQELYMEALETNGRSKDDEGDKLSWTIPHTYKDEEGNTQTIQLRVVTEK